MKMTMILLLMMMISERGGNWDAKENETCDDRELDDAECEGRITNLSFFKYPSTYRRLQALATSLHGRHCSPILS